MELTKQHDHPEGGTTWSEDSMAIQWSHYTDGLGDDHEVAHLVTPDGRDWMQFDFMSCFGRIWSLWDSTTDMAKPRIAPFVPLILGFYWRKNATKRKLGAS